MDSEHSFCFLCCNATTSIVNNENNTRARNKTSPSGLESQLDVIFILKNLLKLPNFQLESHLKESGDNPEDWISLCDQCTKLTDKARELYHEIRKIETQILNKFTSSLPDSDDEENGHFYGNALEFRRKIRSLVKQNSMERENEEDDHGGSLEGDKFAKHLASQTNTFTAQILMVENDGVVPEEEIKEEEETPPPSPSSPPPMSPADEEEEEIVTLSSTESSGEEEDEDDSEEEYSVKIPGKSKPIIETRRRNPFDCFECGDKFPDEATFKNHATLVHCTDIEKYKPCICNCSHCGKQFTTVISLESHVKKVHLPKSLIACPICGKGLTRSRRVHLHMLTTHKDDPATLKLQGEKGISVNKCPMGCQQVFLTKADLDKHFACTHFGVNKDAIFKRRSRITKDGKFECGTCRRVFQMPKYWSDHQWKAHSVEKIKCPVVDCGEVFTEKLGNEFENHWKGVHKKKREKKKVVEVEKGPWICEFCGVEKKRKGDLTSHRKKVHERENGAKLQIIVNGKPVKEKVKEKKKRVGVEEEEPVLCSLCGKESKNKAALSAHVRFVHEKRFSLSCHVCGLGMVDGRRLKIHLLGSHKEDPVSRKLVEENGLRVWRCEVVGCSARFLKKEELDKHVERMHNGGGEEGGTVRFKCKVCGKGFWQRGALREHEMSHDKNSEKSWKCELCGNGFAIRNNLRCHMIKVHKIWRTRTQKS